MWTMQWFVKHTEVPVLKICSVRSVALWLDYGLTLNMSLNMSDGDFSSSIYPSIETRTVGAGLNEVLSSRKWHNAGNMHPRPTPEQSSRAVTQTSLFLPLRPQEDMHKAKHKRFPFCPQSDAGVYWPGSGPVYDLVCPFVEQGYSPRCYVHFEVLANHLLVQQFFNRFNYWEKKRWFPVNYWEDL